VLSTECLHANAYSMLYLVWKDFYRVLRLVLKICTQSMHQIQLMLLWYQKSP